MAKDQAKKKKQSISDQATKALKSRYDDDVNTLYHVFGASVKGKNLTNFFAAFDSNGIKLYEFTNNKELILHRSINWIDWRSVEVDHFTLKSIFLFKGESGQEELIVSDGKGEHAEELIRKHTSINVIVHSRKWYQKIIGFRSGKKWKMIMAAIIYLFILSGIASGFTENEEKTSAEPKQEIEKEESEPVSNDVDKTDSEAKKKAKEKKAAKQKEKEEKAKKKKEEKLAKEKEKDAKKKEKKQAKKEEKERLKNRSIDEKLKEDDSNVKDAKIEDGILTITLDAKSAFSPKSVASTYVYWSFEAINEAFKDDKVKEVEATIKAPLIDNKGNEESKDVVNYTYTKESFDELNYDKFKDLATGQEWRILNESDAYFMHPAIYDEIKEDYQTSLSHGKSKVRDYN